MKMNDTLLDVIKIDLDVNAVPALMGEPGIGKSSIIEDLAKSLNTRAFTLACNQLADKADLTGGRLVTSDDGATWQQVFYPHEVIQSSIKYAIENPRERPILFLDEINRSTSDVTSAALSLPTLRMIGSSHLPENLRIVVAGNNKGNVTMLDEASLSRFSIYNVEPDAETLIGVLGDDINPYVKAVLVKHPELVFAKSSPVALGADGDDDDDATVSVADVFDSGEEMLQLTTPRTIDSISRWLNAVDPAKLQEYFTTAVQVDGRDLTQLEEIIEAKIGITGFTTQLIGEIASGLSQGSVSQAKSLTAPKPSCYASLKAATTVNDLEKIIATLTDSEKSASLVYALFERADNETLIQQLAEQATSILGDHTKLLVQLAVNSMLDDQNVEALFTTNSPVAAQVRPVIEAFAA
jgi:hypothetical protein